MLLHPERHNEVQIWGLFEGNNLLGLVGFFYDDYTDTVQLPFLERIGYPHKPKFQNVSRHLFGLACQWAIDNFGRDVWLCFEAKPEQPLIEYYRTVIGAEINPKLNSHVHLLLTDEILVKLKELIFV